jgi:hypothetical protein
MWYTAGPRGRRATIGAPGTGLFWTQQLSNQPATKAALTGSQSAAVEVFLWAAIIGVAMVLIFTSLSK